MRYFLLFICLLPFLLNAQSFIDFEYKNGKTTCDCNNTLAQNILDTLDETKENERFLACCYHCIGIYYYNEVYDDWEAIKYYKKALVIRKKYQDDLLWKSYWNIAQSYHEVEYYERAIEAIYRGFEINDSFRKNSVAYQYLGNCYVELGEFEKAINALENAIKLASSDYELAEANNSLCFTLIETKDSLNLIRSLKHAEKAIKLFGNENEIGNMASVYGNKGNAYGELNQHKNAIQAHNKAKEIYLQEEDTLNLARTLNNITTTLYTQGKYKEAIKKLNSSLKLKKRYYDNDTLQYTYAANHENLAENYEALDNIDKALEHYQLALQNLTTNFRQKNIQQNPNPKDNNLYIYNKIDLIRVLHLKASAAFKKYQKEGDKTYLTLAEKTYNTAFDFHNQLPQQISTQASRLFQAEVIVPFIENALGVAYELQQSQEQTPETAYRFMEKNKATVLLQAINEDRALQYAGLPDSLLQQEKELRESITAYKKQVNDARQHEEKDKVKQYENLLFEQKNTYDQLIKNLEKKHPEYYKLKYKQNTTTLKDAQNHLDNETAILEYFIGDTSVYVLAIEKNTARLHHLDNLENSEEILKDFRTYISEDSTQLAFVPHAHQLHQWLLATPIKNLNTNIKHLQIIPDAQLNYLPFGLLIDSIPTNPSYQNLPYLLQQKSISYAYSTTLLLENQQQKRSKASYLYGGFAPIYHKDDLSDGRENVEAQAKKFKGKAFLADQATTEQFDSLANQFQILHLAMHGILDDEESLYSKLIFADTALYAADLYNIPLNADLAILSACNTGTGNIKKGEGVMSLSRAFTYAGCPSLLMSLWSVPDGGTAKVVDAFLEELQQGKTKDKALQTAQLNYLKNTAPDRLHPMYWAGLVPSGNMQPVEFNPTCNCWWIMALILLIIIYFGQKIIRPSKAS